MTASKKRIQKHQADLNILARSDSKTKKAIIREAPNSLICAICDCAGELLEGRVEITGDQLNSLRKYRAPIRRLGDAGSVTSKRALLLKGGSGAKALSALVRTVTSPSETSDREKFRRLVQRLR